MKMPTLSRIGLIEFHYFKKAGKMGVWGNRWRSFVRTEFDVLNDEAFQCQDGTDLTSNIF